MTTNSQDEPVSNSRFAAPDSVATLRLKMLPAGEGTEPVAPGVLAVTTDPNGLVTWCSAAVEALVGRPRAAMVGRPFPLEIFDANELDRRASAVGRPSGHELFLLDPSSFDRRRGGEPNLGDLDRRRSGRAGICDRSAQSRGPAGSRSSVWSVTGADDVQRVISLTLRTICDETGSVLGYLAQAVDATEEHQTSRLLAQALLREQEATRQLVELDQLRSDFVATAGHELRTPLTSILGFVELLEDGIDNPERRSLATSAIRRNVVRLHNLAEGLVLLSNANPDPHQPPPPLDLRDVVEAVRADLLSMMESHEVVPELVVSEHPVNALGDGPRLQLAVGNLIVNALRSTPSGGRVTCRVAASSGGAMIEVSDTGPGVPDSELPHLFSPFFRGAAAREAGLPGAGLALSIVAAVVEKHGGRLLVSKNEPQGSVFTVHLPSAEGGLCALSSATLISA